jgi:hypothetical protein
VGLLPRPPGLAQGDPARARSRFAEAIELFEGRKAKIAMNVLALIGLARCEQALGRGPAAATAADRAITLAETFVEKDAPSYLVGLSRAVLGEVQLANGEGDAARTSFQAALGHLERTLGGDHPATKDARSRALSSTSRARP